jgi:succinoglycan biosynthesis protein ExoM
MLGRLLYALLAQKTEGTISFAITVVDNDENQSAREEVTQFSIQSTVGVSYDVEPEQNIALARNRALANGDGELIAFIDDDEIPGERWLLTLYGTLIKFKADGALGPVLPAFERSPPSWVVKGRFFDRPSHPTGQTLDWKHTRTGNALLRRRMFMPDAMWFNPKYGSGGEDRDMFRRMIEIGHVFVWCDQAPVFETVPASRWKRTVLVKRALLRGRMALNSTDARLSNVAKSGAAFAIYVVVLPAALLMGHHIFMHYLINACDHLGKVLGYFNWDVVKEKYISG